MTTDHWHLTVVPSDPDRPVFAVAPDQIVRVWFRRAAPGIVEARVLAVGCEPTVTRDRDSVLALAAATYGPDYGEQFVCALAHYPVEMPPFEHPAAPANEEVAPWAA